MGERMDMAPVDQGARDKLAQLELVIMRHVDVCTNEREHLKEQRQADNDWKKRVEDNIEEMKRALVEMKDAIPDVVRDAMRGLASEKSLSKQVNSQMEKWLLRGSIAANGLLGAGMVWLFGHVMKWW